MTCTSFMGLLPPARDGVAAARALLGFLFDDDRAPRTSDDSAGTGAISGARGSCAHTRVPPVAMRSSPQHSLSAPTRWRPIPPPLSGSGGCGAITPLQP